MPIPLKEINNFYSKISNSPSDFELRNIFSDWLFDHGFYELQKVQLFLIEQGIYPSKIRMDLSRKFRWIFGTDTNKYAFKEFSNCLLPEKIFKIIAGRQRQFTWLYFGTCRKAEESLIESI